MLFIDSSSHDLGMVRTNGSPRGALDADLVALFDDREALARLEAELLFALARSMSSIRISVAPMRARR